jgi:hypothetical protein
MVTNEAESAIIIFGCNVETLKTIRVKFIEKTPMISDEILIFASYGPIKLFRDPSKITRDGFCTCIYLHNKNRELDVQERTLLFISLDIFGSLAFITIVLKLFKIIMNEEHFPFLP